MVESENNTSTTECIKIPFDIEDGLNSILKILAIYPVEKDTYIKWTGDDIFYDNELAITKGNVYEVIVTENGRVIIDFGDKMFGWVRPDNFEFFEVVMKLIMNIVQSINDSKIRLTENYFTVGFIDLLLSS